MLIWLLANAPGSATSYAEVSTPGDSDPSNDVTEVLTHTVSCSVEGTDGDDVLQGTADTDLVCGKGGDDVITQVGDGDKVMAGVGNDTVKPILGWGIFDGGAGEDTIDYSDASEPVTVSLDDRAAVGPGRHMLNAFEVVVGTEFGDYMEGDRKDNLLLGGEGQDLLMGRGGRDELRAGDGDDEMHSRDEFNDVARGGIGEDEAFVDDGDDRESARKVSSVPFLNRDPKSPTPR